MAYEPKFDRNAKGKYNPSNGFISIKNGTDAILLEDELNEMQWIQADARANLTRKMSETGCLQINDFTKPTSPGGLVELGSGVLNSFKLMGFDAVLDGNLAYIDTANLSGSTITLSNPSSNLTARVDFAYLEFWFKELDANDIVTKYGGTNNSGIPYEMLDSRINMETSYRVQLQWAFRSIANVDKTTYINGFTNINNVVNANIKAQGPNLSPINGYNFIKSSYDNSLFISGTGTTTDKNNLGTIDGYIYAFPMFFINRLNNMVYNAATNPNGGVDWVSSSTVSGRPDGKFSNIIYKDQVTDLRNFATLGKKQYDLLYPALTEYNSNKSTVSTHLTNLDTSITTINGTLTNHENRIKGLETQFKNMGLDPARIDQATYGLDMFKTIVNTSGGTLQGDGTTILSVGATVQVPYNTYNNYVVIPTLESVPLGKIGDLWVEKADTSFIIKNTGYAGCTLDTIAVSVDSTRVYRNYATFNGTTGIKINQPVKDTDFITIVPTAGANGQFGAIYIVIATDKSYFTVYNTGGIINKTFEWVIIDTTKLTNVSLYNISLNGPTIGATTTGTFGTKFNVITGALMSSSPSTIGDISIQKAFNSFTVYNTGSGMGSVRTLVFKEVNS